MIYCYVLLLRCTTLYYTTFCDTFDFIEYWTVVLRQVLLVSVVLYQTVLMYAVPKVH